MIETAALVLFPALMAYAAASDLLTMTISNRISIALVLGFAAVSLASGMPVTALLTDHLACGFAVLALTFAFFARGWIGGGDAKLAAATAVWLGWAHLYEYALAASLLGAVLTVGILKARKRELPSRLAAYPFAKRLHLATNGVPYGIALAAAGLALYPDTAIWAAVAGN